MNEVVLRKLEFDKVTRHASGFCISPMGSDRVLDHSSFPGPEELQDELGRVLELKNFLLEERPLPFSQLPDTRGLLKKLELAESFLEPEELLDIYFLLRSSVDLRKFMFNNREHYPLLNEFTIRIWLEKSLQFAITSVIDDQGQVKDSASEGLLSIRKELNTSRQSLRRKMERLLRRCSENGWLMEDTVAMKNGRLVLGLRVEYKHKLAGYIQDYSQTAQTVFIEPGETLEISNRLQDLDIAERREIERILKSLSEEVRQKLPDIRHNQEILAGFDALYARARLALETRSVLPALADDQTIRIIKGLSIHGF